MERRVGLPLAGAVVWALSACGATGVAPSLEGAWLLTGYADHGVAGATTGSMEFRTDGTFRTLGTVTYPGEPLDSLDVTGTYELDGNAAVTLVVGTDTSNWSITWGDDTATLTLQEPPPRSAITLARAMR